MADNGYDINVLDEIDGGNGHGIADGSNPDFLIEGNVFDCYGARLDGKVQSIKSNSRKDEETFCKNCFEHRQLS